MKNSLLGVAMLFMAFASSGMVSAQDVLLDDVESSVESEWAEIRVHFIMPVNYERHFPLEHGELLKIFFTATGPEMKDVSLRKVTRHVSETPVLPDTTITLEPPLSLNLQRDPWSLYVRFNRDVNYSVRPGDDNRSIVIYIPVVPVEHESGNAPKETPSAKDRPAR